MSKRLLQGHTLGVLLCYLVEDGGKLPGGGNMWTLFEKTTGLEVTSGKTQKQAIASFIQRAEDRNWSKDYVKETIKHGIDTFGKAPQLRKKGYFYKTVRGGRVGHPVPKHVRIKGKPVIVPGWEEFKFFISKE